MPHRNCNVMLAQAGMWQHDGKRWPVGARTDMKSAPFTYTRAASVAQAIELLAVEPDARLLAGGQSLGPMLNLRLARPTRLIDLKRASELRLLEADSRHLRLGACWTHAEIEDGTIEDPTNGLLPHVARGIAYRAVRNRGTVGGSLAHADPAADWLATMAVLGAAIIVQGSGGARRCAATTFVQGPFATVLGPAELIVAIEVPRRQRGHGLGGSVRRVRDRVPASVRQQHEVARVHADCVRLGRNHPDRALFDEMEVRRAGGEADAPWRAQVRRVDQFAAQADEREDFGEDVAARGGHPVGGAGFGFRHAGIGVADGGCHRRGSWCLARFGARVCSRKYP